MQVQAFREKLDLETAQQYIAKDGYFWNAGMFVLKATVSMSALQRFRPIIAQAVRALWVGRTADNNTASRFVRPGRAEFDAIPLESVDFAVIEHCHCSEFPKKMAVLDASWSDLGAWSAV